MKSVSHIESLVPTFYHSLDLLILYDILITLANITSALSKVVNHVFSQKSVSIPAKSILNISELSAFIIATLAVLSILGEAWDPREWIIMRSPHATIRERWYYPWTRMVALPLLALEFHLLFAKPPTQQSLHPLMSPYLVTLLLSCVRLAISSTAKWVQMPIQIKLSDSAETDHTTPEPALRGENDTSRHSTTRRRQMSPLDALPLLSRSASDPSNNAQEDWGRWSSKGSGSWNGPSASDIETIDWGSSRAPLPASATPFADFGTYRESASFQSTSLAPNLQQVGSDRGGSKTTLNDTKYFSRAYEPSPLANPSLINGLNIGNMSLGKMFGFPSAEIQQPENHFAHRSHSPSMDPQQDVWSYRKKSMDADLDIDANENENEDEDEDVARTKASMWRRNGPKAPTKQTQFGMGLMSMSSSSQYRGKSKFEKREDFAAQRYFPPEPETGLEENFFGVVKIVDDYLPHRERPVSFIDRKMDFLSSGFSALRGQKGQHQSGSETVDRLCERIEHGTLLEDRRASVLALKACSRDHKRDIGSRGVNVLSKVLRQDSMDLEICKAVLETLAILCQTDAEHEESQEFGKKMSATFLEDPVNVTILLDILEEYDFYVRFHVVSLLSTLVLNDSQRLQECILTSPVGMSRLMALLDDRREIIRNEGLLLLISLTETNADLQKIVAFENAFERLLTIIEEEGGINGGIIVQDCLQLVQNLLRYNVSNQNYFRETSCIQRIPDLFREDMVRESGHSDLPHGDAWSDQKGNNMIMVLELIRVLVVPDHSNTATNQKSMSQCGIVQLLITLALTSNAPQRVKASAFYALAELVRLNKANQDVLFKAVIAPAHPPPVPHEDVLSSLSPPNRSSVQLSRSSFQQGRGTHDDHGAHQRASGPRAKCPAVVETVAIAVGQYPGCSYSVRASATCLFQALLLENPDTQLVLASTLNPPPEDNPNTVSDEKPHSPGTLLLGALQGWQEDAEILSMDPYNSWFATVLFSHILQNNPRAKSIALAITFGDEEQGEDPVSLINAITAALMIAVKSRADARVALGYLALLCNWCYDCPKSVKDFLSEGAHLQFLIELISPSSKEDPMVQGLAAFLLGICYEFNWEPDAPITRATIQPIILSRIGVDHFASCITRVRESKPFNAATPWMIVLPKEEGPGKLPALFFDYSFVEFMKRTFGYGGPSKPKVQINDAEAESKMQSLVAIVASKDSEISDLKAQLESKVQSLVATVASKDSEISDLKVQLEEAYQQLTQQAHERQEHESTLARLNEEVRLSGERYTALEKEHEDLLICLAEQEEDMTQLKERVLALGLNHL
ncbi:hypothetical protein BGW38_003820 [Lunasporangiospora selenospora]|uniref:Uncharacterized protein n=1 Tax=Lunasporangiospora selenospora TaxID=979761 RepID=A0A9P6G3K4_9FUNG|nr:hypothetical protein BGW38_003820 [Lunasporangiospora selenospora]